MTTPSVTPETLTFDHIKSWDGQTMKDQMRRPEMREAIYKVIAAKPIAEVEAAQAEIESRTPVAEPVVETVAEPVVETPVVPVAEVVPVEPVISVAPKKIVVDYQVKDEDGNPIGRPTHLEAATEEEMRGKIIEAHVQATRAFHRLKKQKLTFKEPVAPAAPKATDEELLAYMKDLKSDDPQKQLEAVRKVNEADTRKIQAEADKKVAEAQELHRQQMVSQKFLADHKHDYNNCQANIKMIEAYFVENELAWTSDNLELAFHALESELAPVEKPVVPTPPANPVPVVAPVVQQPVTPVSVQPQVVAPAPAASPANPVVAAHRPGVNGGIEPGQNSGVRPSAAAPKGLTAEEIKSWDGATMRLKMRNPAIRAQIEAFAASRSQAKK
jgi:hypothetical protein